MKFSLSDLLSYSDRYQLTDEQKQAFVDVIGHRCHERTKARLRSFITYPTGAYNHGIYNRVMFDEGGCQYVAGQSYPDELRTIRKLIVKD